MAAFVLKRLSECFFLEVPMADSLGKINNIVVLMMENRSFDHLLGFFRPESGVTESLSGTETVPFDPQDPNSRSLPVTRDAAYVGDFNLDPHEADTFVDPSHEVPSGPNQWFRGSPNGKPFNQRY